MKSNEIANFIINGASNLKNENQKDVLRETAIEMIENFAEAKVDQNETVVGWIEFEGNEKLFDKEARKNCKIMFGDGSICRYYDEQHPRAIMTHFKIEES